MVVEDGGVGGRGWRRPTLACPRRNTVSNGKRMKSSAVAETNVRMEYEVGDRTGSIPRRDRRMSGVEDEIKTGKVLWTSVTGRRLGGQLNSDSSCMAVMMEREGDDVGVRISLSFISHWFI